jgi:Amt family ammonium transporter
LDRLQVEVTEVHIRVFAGLLALAALAHGQPQVSPADYAALQAAVKTSQSAGDNAWVLVSSALVLMMTGPGLALFYCGLVRKKNVLGTMMHSFAMMALITLIWGVCGYSLVFGGGNPFIGDLRYAFLHGVGAAPNAMYAPTIPHTTFMVYQLMFAIITPALIAGAFAERVRFSAMMIFATLWYFWCTSRSPTWCGAMADS